jgi:hypothetical protein
LSKCSLFSLVVQFVFLPGKVWVVSVPWIVGVDVAW